MSVAHLALLFCVQMAFGALTTFAIADRDAIGPKYFKFGGWILIAFYGLAGSMVWGSGQDTGATSPHHPFLGTALAIAALSVLAFSSITGWDKPRFETLTLWVSLIAGAAAISYSLPPASSGGTRQALAHASALGSALVLGFTSWGMILGHWYLVDKNLDLRHLARIVKPLPWILLGKAVIAGLILLLFWEDVLGDSNQSMSDLLQRQPERILDVVNIWARIPIGLLIPAALGWMALVTVRLKKTQPATGILYAMCGVVYLGELMGKMVEGSTGVPF
ncbi:MAG: hypothetical protein VX916_02525 [Planctomycetota bacterium]|nr:hypothetical protein [Planctomycetota bacterium]